MKTIATTLIMALLLVTAFTGNSGSDAKENNLKKVLQTEINIHEAVLKGDIGAVQRYIQSGKDLDVKEQTGGSTALTTAAVFGKTEIAEALIGAGANVNLVNNEGSTALHSAAFFCRTEIVIALLENGADKSVKNKSGSTAFESVNAPFEAVKGIYEYFAQVYQPLGLELDFEKIKATRPVIAEMLK